MVIMLLDDKQLFSSSVLGFLVFFLNGPGFWPLKKIFFIDIYICIKKYI